ncbi:MAG: ATP-binding protein [Clostridiales bacterium]
MKLYRKIMLLIIAVVFVAIVSFMPFATLTVSSNIQDKVEDNILNIAKTVAKSPFIRTALEEKDPEGEIADYVDDIYNDISEVEFIVVADMNSKRYSHPVKERVGEKFVGNDEIKVIETGEMYISEGKGTLGKSLRVFVPIYNMNETTQIGFISVGTLMESITKAKFEAQGHIIIAAWIGLLTGFFGAVFLTKNIKKSLLGLEPEEISKLYNEKDSMLKGIHEGIVAIDSNYNINMINISALKILGLEKRYKIDTLIGKPILSVFKNSRLPHIVKTGLAEYNFEQVINNTVILTNRVPIKDKKEIIGALATFKDKTQITHLAEEVTGVKLIVEALRANTHEFMNKLHVILGLIHLGEVKKAQSFIMQTVENQELIFTDIIQKIKDSNIAGLLIGKASRAKELGIHFEIDEDCKLKSNEKGKITNHTLVTIIGNLLENAFFAVDKSSLNKKKVYFKILETDEIIQIIIKDTGIGIKESEYNKIFERGYTTKEGSKGVGLELVIKSINILEGDINVKSKVNEGTTFNIILPKGSNEVVL